MPGITESHSTELATELRDGLLQDLVAVGLMVQLAIDAELCASPIGVRALEEIRAVLTHAPDRLRGVIDRLGPPA